MTDGKIAMPFVCGVRAKLVLCCGAVPEIKAQHAECRVTLKRPTFLGKLWNCQAEVTLWTLVFCPTGGLTSSYPHEPKSRYPKHLTD